MSRLLSTYEGRARRKWFENKKFAHALSRLTRPENRGDLASQTEILRNSRTF